MKKALILSIILMGFQFAQATDLNTQQDLLSAEELTLQLDSEGLDAEIEEEFAFDNQVEALSRNERRRDNLGNIIGRRIVREIFRPRPRPVRQVICEARNLRGHLFTAVGARPYRVQQRALAKCDRVSRRCHSLGCRRVDRWR